MKRIPVLCSCLVVLIVAFAGCRHRGGESSDEQRSIQGIWETSWVDPQLVISEQMFTLIRSERIDSFLVTKPSPYGSASLSVSWQVGGTGCNATVNLLDTRGSMMQPLLVQRLRPGYYKLTLDFSRVDYTALPSGEYLLSVEHCGEVRTARVVRR